MNKVSFPTMHCFPTVVFCEINWSNWNNPCSKMGGGEGKEKKPL